MLTTSIAVVALVIAAIAVTLAIAVMRQSGDATAAIRRHRRAHADAHGYPDPKLDRRQVNLGAPRSTGERRGATRFEAPPDRLMPPPPAEPEQLPAEPLPTEHLPAAELPTTMLGAQRPDVPDVRDIRRRP